MTIRDQIARRVRWLLAIAFAAWLYVMLAMPTAAPKRNAPPLSLVIGVAVMFLAIQCTSLVRCPKCMKRFGRGIAMRIGAPLWRTPVKFCPHCGVSLDQQLPP
jgi:hypothetical protein